MVLGIPAMAAGAPPTEAKPLAKEKLQIVFLLGQSNMVGLADIGTSWYLTQPQYVPPREEFMKKSESFDWNNFFWQGVRYYQGPPELEKQLADLVDEREASRAKWRGRAKGEWKAEWGTKPTVKGRDQMYAFLDQKAGEEGIYDRMAKILSGPENKFPMEKAYEEIIGRDEHNAEQIKRVREIYLNGTKGEAFDPFIAELDAVRKRKKKDATETPEQIRVRLAKMGEQAVGLPIAKRTHIFSHGAFESSDAPIDTLATGHGPLSIGWGGSVTMIGPEYGVGITLERLVDAPILLVKCSWGNTALREAWRPGSLDGVETPIEKAERETWNAAETAAAKADGREAKLRPAPVKTGKPSWAWNMALPAIKKVLENPGLYHPDYDPAKGYDIAGMLWFQGYSDMGNPAYGEQLEEMIKWFRSEINAPKMPVVCGSLGVGAYYSNALTGNVSGGMVKAAQSPDLIGTVDVVNTGRFYPLDLDAADNMLKVYEKGSPQAVELGTFVRKTTSNKAFHYRGSAKFFMLTGDAMARSLANLMAGGEPSIHAETKAAN
jgi:hypothetical protein